MLKRGEVVKLVRVVAETREIEIGCDDCFERLDSFAETELSGLEASAAMPLVSDHLNRCADCRSKFEAQLSCVSLRCPSAFSSVASTLHRRGRAIAQARHEVTVAVQGDRDVRVSQRLLHDLWVDVPREH